MLLSFAKIMQSFILMQKHLENGLGNTIKCLQEFFTLRVRNLLEYGVLKSMKFEVQIHFVTVLGYILALILFLLVSIFGIHCSYGTFHLVFWCSCLFSYHSIQFTWFVYYF